MNKALSQNEIDTLVDALNTLKSYADDSTVTADILKSQVVLTQHEIDALLSSLTAKGSAADYKPTVNVALSQPEIDSLIDALNSLKEYDPNDAIDEEIDTNQSVLSQLEIDGLIEKLLALKGN